MSDDDPPIDPPSYADPAIEPEFVHSDPAQLRRLLRGSVVTLIGLVVIGLSFRYWLMHADAFVIVRGMFWLSYLVGFGLLAVAVHAWRYAQRIFRSAQFPPPGAWVLGPTRVLRGTAAQRSSRWVLVGAVVLVALAACAFYLPHASRNLVFQGSLPAYPSLPVPAASGAHG